MTPTRIAMIGYGAIAERHAIALRELGASIKIVAGPDRDGASAFAERFRVPRVAVSVKQAIEAQDIDAVVIASPSAAHAAQARAALVARRSVLVEIPLALSASAAEELVALASRQERTLMVCHTLRYAAPFRAAHAAIERDDLVPRHVVARTLMRRRDNVGWTGRRRTWTDDLLWHHGCHAVDAVLGFLGGTVERVTAAAGPRWDGSGLPMDYGITVRTVGGGVGTIALSYNSLTDLADYVVIADTEAVLVEAAKASTPSRVLYTGVDDQVVHSEAVLAQDHDFLDSIRHGQTSRAEAVSVLPTMRVLQTIHDRVGRGRDVASPAPVID